MIAMDSHQIEACEHRVREVLADLRPFLEADGGDITLDEVSPEGIAMVRLHGACSNCSMSAMTLKAGVEEAIKRVAPQVVSVRSSESKITN